MKKITFNIPNYGLVGLPSVNIEGIPLAKFKIKIEDAWRVQHRFLFFKWSTSKWAMVEKNKWLVFIPWKHSEKEVVLVDDADVVSQDFSFPQQWINVSKFISPYTEELPDWGEKYEVADFCGYPFIVENESFIANIKMYYNSVPLKILYKQFPEFLKLEHDEEYHLRVRNE